MWDATHCQSEVGHIDMFKFGQNGANILGCTPLSTKMFISAFLPSFKHSVLRGATYNTKIPHKAPYSILTTPQCSFGKSGQMDNPYALCPLGIKNDI